MRSESERSAVADFRVMDPDGNLLLRIDEARCQKVDFQHSAASPFISRMVAAGSYRQSRLFNAAALPSPSEIQSSVNGRVNTDRGRE